MPDLNFELRSICDADRLTGLRLGDEAFVPLKTFLQRDAKKYHTKDLAKTYGLFLSENTGERIVGYVTLICAEVSTDFTDGLDQDGIRYTYPGYPALKIARLAVDIRYQKQFGFGRKLVEFAQGIAKSEICPRVGCRFLVVDAKKPSIEFYKKCGFTMLDTDRNRKRSEPVMFIDMTKIFS